MPARPSRGTAASATVPQAWHSPHRPTHLGACQPHSLQRNAAVDFAMPRTLSAGSDIRPGSRGKRRGVFPREPKGASGAWRRAGEHSLGRPAASGRAQPGGERGQQSISLAGDRASEEDAMTVLPAIPVVLSSSSVYPEKTPDAFDAAAKLGYDGVEVMVYTDPVSQSGDALARLVDYHQVPVLAVHAPGLLLTQLVWGREPWSKLLRAKDLAERLGAKVVVVHPPFRWQREYTKGFEDGISKMSEETDVIFAVENMYPIRSGASEISGYAPHWDPTKLDVPNVTLDLSHTAASASDAIVMANDIGSRLAHIHLADGTGVSSGPVPDEHLVPGRGRQPCAELLRGIAATGYQGMVVAEVNTRHAAGSQARRADLAETLAFARTHLSQVPVR